ncbi:hypothetical protein DL767_000475 [Monosporascus sp. MG133]|nr:hypothetical protein DL767_000475 [Monosporascus sp. MG133]
MKFTTILALALPAVAAAQPLVTTATEAAPAPTGTAPNLMEICEEEAGSYADVCGRCLYRLSAGSTAARTAGTERFPKYVETRHANGGAAAWGILYLQLDMWEGRDPEDGEGPVVEDSSGSL